MNKVLMITPFYYPKIGGVEKHVAKVCSALMKKGYEINVVAVNHNNELPEREQLDGIDIYRITVKDPANPDKWEIWRWLNKHRSLITDSQLIHCHDKPIWYFPFRFLYPKKPFYMTFHGYEGYPLDPRAILYRKLAAKLAAGNICIGDYIQKWYGIKATLVSYGGVDYRILDNKFFLNSEICFIGRLSPDTGIMAYLEAIRILRDESYKEFTLHICGDGPLRSAVEAFAQAHRLRVKMYGYVENPEAYVDKCSIAFVSGYLAILESMVAKRLVVSIYDNPLKKDYLMSIPDCSNKMVLAGNPRALAEKLVKIVGNPSSVLSLVNNGYEWAKNQSWNSVANTYLQLWEQD